MKNRKHIHAIPPWPIDVVYLWVDGNDPDWLEKKEDYLLQARKAGKDIDYQAIAPGRFIDNQELRHSLRSLEQNLPWINHIFIVTDGQCPSWLNCQDSRITVVDHKEICPPDALPTFNAEAIETRLPFIPDLSEHFIFFNDDMLCLHPCGYDVFFNQQGIPVQHIRHGHYTEADFTQEKLEILLKKTVSLWDRILIRANYLAYQKYGKFRNFYPVHSPDPYRKSFLLDNLSDPSFQELFQQTLYHRFRMDDDLDRIIFTLMDAANHRVILKHCDVVAWKKIFPYRRTTLKIRGHDDLQKIARHKYRFLCISDGEFMSDDFRSEIPVFLSNLFPCLSKWEK